MGETFAGLVTDGPLLVAAGVAALVGLISFASPCVLPLVPGYLSYVAGLVGTPASRPDPGPSGSGGTTTAVRTEVAVLAEPLPPDPVRPAGAAGPVPTSPAT